jgi:ABC-type transport system involved in multi-copper enzyme maturation permease subunit
MTIHWRRIRAVARKELLELSGNKTLLAALCALPAIMAVTPWLMVWAYAREPDNFAYREMARYYGVLEKGVPAGASLIAVSVEKWLAMFLVAPAFLPIQISGQAIAGEKEKRTIEPLLASPASELEILLGKSLASVVPAVVSTWVFFVLFAVGCDALAYPLLHRLLVPDGLWLFGMIVLAPLLSLLGNGLAVAISARVTDPRIATQLAALFVMPGVGLGGLSMAGLASFSGWFWLGSAFVLVGLDVLLLRWAVRNFDRERILTRWG